MRGLFTLFLVLGTLAFPAWVGLTYLPALAAPESQPMAEQLARFARTVHVTAPAQANWAQTQRIPRRTADVFAPPHIAPYSKQAPPPQTSAKANRVSVAIPNAALRTGPASGPVVVVPSEGENLDVVDRALAEGQEWLEVRTSDGQQGWISGRVVRAATG